MLLLTAAFAQSVDTVAVDTVAVDTVAVEATTAGLTDDSLNAVVDIPVDLAAPPVALATETAVAPQPVEEVAPLVTTPPPAEADVAGFTMDQVFAEEQGLTAVASVPSSTGFGSYGWVIGIAGLGLAFAGRKVLTNKLSGAKAAPQRLEVLDRKGLGANSGLMLVEVETTEGGRRRLLVGIGQGSPTLVADLGGDVPGFPDPNMDATFDFPVAGMSATVAAVQETPTDLVEDLPTTRFSGKFTDDDLAEDHVRTAPVRAAKTPTAKTPTAKAVAGRSRNEALKKMARQSRAPLGKRTVAASPWSKTVDAMPRTPAEAAKRLENRKGLIADVLSGRAA
jgi:hypothetical protein